MEKHQVTHNTKPASLQQILMHFVQDPTELTKTQDWLFQKGENLFMDKEQIVVAAYLWQCLEHCQPQAAQRDVGMFGNL